MKKRNFFTYTFHRRAIVVGLVGLCVLLVMLRACQVTGHVLLAVSLVVGNLIFCGLFLLINFFRWIQYKQFNK